MTIMSSSNATADFRKLAILGVTRAGRTFTARWTYSEGCISGITTDKYYVFWRTAYSPPGHPAGTTAYHFRVDAVSGLHSEYIIPSHVTDAISVSLYSISIKPENRNYGSPYYPEQSINITVNVKGD